MNSKDEHRQKYNNLLILSSPLISPKSTHAFPQPPCLTFWSLHIASSLSVIPRNHGQLHQNRSHKSHRRSWLRSCGLTYLSLLFVAPSKIVWDSTRLSGVRKVFKTKDVNYLWAEHTLLVVSFGSCRAEEVGFGFWEGFCISSVWGDRKKVGNVVVDDERV